MKPNNECQPTSPAFTDHEEKLRRVEKSWADCAARLRVDKMESCSLSYADLDAAERDLLGVHELLDKHRIDHNHGLNPAALFDAMMLCIRENLPLPYWAAKEMIRIESFMEQEPMLSLHTALRLGERFPLTEKKAIKAMRNREIEDRLCKLVSADPVHWRSLNAAIKNVLKLNPDIANVFSIRKATEVFKRVSIRHSKVSFGDYLENE